MNISEGNIIKLNRINFDRILFLGLIIFAFLLPWEIDFRHFGINLPIINTNLEIIVFILVILWIISKIQNKDYYFFKRSPFYISIISFIAIHIISSLFATEKVLWAFGFTSKLIGGILIYFLVIDIVKSESQIRKIFYAIFISATIISILGILEKFFPHQIHKFLDVFSKGLTYLPQDNTLRVKSTFVYPNVLAMYLEIVILLMIGYILRVSNNIKKVLLMIIIFISTECLVLTYSRGGMLGFFISLFIFYLILFRNKNMQKYLTNFRPVLLGICLIFLITIIVDGIFLSRLYNVTNIEDNPTRERIYMWLTALHMFAERPLIGIGPDNFRWLYMNKYALAAPFSSLKIVGGIPNNHSNSFFLEMFASVGLIGGIIFLWIMIKIFSINIFNLKKNNTQLLPLSVGIICVFVAFYTHGLVDYFWFVQSILLFFWFVLGLSETIK